MSSLFDSKNALRKVYCILFKIHRTACSYQSIKISIFYDIDFLHIKYQLTSSPDHGFPNSVIIFTFLVWSRAYKFSCIRRMKLWRSMNVLAITTTSSSSNDHILRCNIWNHHLGSLTNQLRSCRPTSWFELNLFSFKFVAFSIEFVKKDQSW